MSGWSLDEVVDEHKKGARAIWVLLLLIISSLTTWLVVKAVRGRANPTTSFSVSDDPYDYPKIAVCLDYEKGCDWINPLTLDECADGMEVLFAQYGNSTLNETVLDRDDQGDLEDRCRVFDLPSAIEATEDDKDDGNPGGFVDLVLSWYAGYADGDEEFTSGGEPFEVSVPYDRIQYYQTSSGTSYIETEVQKTTMFIGRTRMEYLDKSKNSAVYSALAMSTVRRTHTAGDYTQEDTSSERDWEVDSIGGYLYLEIVPSRLSNYRFKEDDPLDLEVLFGTVGGLWEVLLLVTGVAFVTISQPTARLRFRNFKRPYREVRRVLSARKGKIEGGAALPECDTAGGMGEEERQVEDQQGRQARLACIELRTARFFRRPVVQEKPPAIKVDVPGQDKA